MTGKWIVVAALMVQAAGLSNAEQNRFLPQQNEFLNVIRSVHEAQENTGFVFMMAHRGKVVLVDFAGTAVLEHGVPVTRDSRFPVMSITKAFTGLALASAVAEGLLELDKPIANYLPDYEGEGAEAITLRQLATHTSGIPHTGHPERRDLYVRHFDSANESRYVYEEKELLFAPGSDYAYSSSGYNLIAAVIEKQSGVNFKDYVASRVLSALDLQNSGFDDILEIIHKRVRNYSFVDIWAQPWRAAEHLQQVPTWDFSYNLGGGNMYSDAADLLTLGQALVDSKGLSESVWNIALQRAEPWSARSSWSLGWIHGKDPQGRQTIHITGATPGVQAALYTYPAENLVFVALANCWGKNSAGAELVVGAPQRLVDAYLQNDQEK